ncbi:ribonuclease H-like domain-containing protein [Tanacetum coccineum]|uniref:Ribonuclease H-like domain-containing protein n=1 Tax=Tanacetum coccineum TaxID=301880 RepID=A0ABQ5A0W8_9ASTR
MSIHNSEHTLINSDHADDFNDSVTKISKLDIIDPLHLHPNDTTALTVVSIKLKGTENYQVWSCAMLLALEGKNKIGFNDGSCKRSNTDEVLGKQAKHVWKELKETYDKVDGSIMFGLLNQINTLKQNGSSIADYYHKLNALWKQYDAMIELPKCVCNAFEGFKKHNQLLNLMQFLMGLDDSYMQIRSSILSRETLPDVRSAYATISSEDQNFQRNSQNFNTGPSRPNTVNNNRQGGGSGLNNNKPSGGFGLVCENYGFNGHTIDRCFKIIGYPADFEKKRSGKNVKKQGVSNNNSVGKCSSSGFTDEQWKKLGHPNGTEAYIFKNGNLRLSNGLTLYDVMVILEYCVTLISVHKLVKENKVIVAFDENICYFLNQDSYLKNILGLVNNVKAWSSCNPVLNVLKDSLNFDKRDNTGCCEICQMAKQTREPFPLSDHKSKNLRDLVHLDLWRPYKVTRSKGFRFCLTVVDDYTRAVWVYLIKSKDEDSEVGKNDSTNVLQDVNHINFFDIEYPEIPNDDERLANDLNKGKSDSSSSSESGNNINTADFPVDSGNDANSSNDFVATQNEEVATLEENVLFGSNLDQNPSSSQGVHNIRRSSRQSVFLKNYNDFVVESKVKYGLEKYVGYSKLNSKKNCFISQLNKTREPKTYFEASKYSHWINAMNQEMSALLRNGLVIGCSRVFQLDVNNVFLYGDLEEVVYMKPPEGYFPFDNKVCRLKKSLHGLKQALRQWNAKLTSTLIENGFSQSKSDYSLYTKFDKGVFLALLVYVDDIIITGNSVSEIEKFKVFLKSKFMIKDLGKLKYFLGIEVVDTDKGICLNQRKYVLDLLSEYGMLACKPAKTPLLSKLVISNEASDKDPLLENITDYRKLMGKLIYLTNTRPDISYVVHCLSQFMHSPLTSHLKIAFKILRYLKSCPGLGVHITKTSGMFLTAYSDADWAKCIVTRKSVTGYCVFLNNSLVSWKSKKQNT